MINYAHRGASEYAPENTMSSFYLGLLQGANGIETDVQRTLDGELVLFHDMTLDRVTDGSGSVSDYTLAELRELKVTGNATTGFFDRIVTLREFLEVFSNYNIHFAIELKVAGVEADAVAMVKEYGIMDRTTFTSFDFECIRKTKEICPEARIGWLVVKPTREILKALKDIGGEELAPKADEIHEETIAYWRSQGFGIRAWGVTRVELMKEMCRLGVDGMTVNFPDRLFQYLAR
ncbi:MAG: hypothetical protein IKZ21_00025 [Clostridia bacterium]|nr:hypothetical protein [Clostridia bacterium]